MARLVAVEDLKVGLQRLIAPRLAGLALQRADLALHLFDDVADAKQVRLGRLQLPHRLFLLAFVFRDAGRFFEHRAPVFRAGAEDQVDLALLHDRVGAAADAGIGEERLDIAQPADRLVEEILGVAVAKDAPGDAHLVPVDAELLLAVGEGQRDFGKADRLARIRAAENDVGHFAAAQRFGRLLAEHPADGIEDVGFAAAVRPDDGGDAFVEIEDRFVGERLEADELKRLEMHAGKAAVAAERCL